MAGREFDFGFAPLDRPLDKPGGIRLSKAMKASLRRLLRGQAPGHAGSMRALQRRRLADGEGLTSLGRTVAMTLIPLSEQAERLSVPIRTVRVPAGEPPELAVRRQQLEAGGSVSFCEGGALRMLLYSGCFPRLYRLALAKYGGPEGARSYLYGSLGVYKEFTDEVPDLPAKLARDISITDETGVLASFDRLRSWQWEDAWSGRNWVGVEREHIRALFRALQGAPMERLARRLLEGPRSFFQGWPDLVTVQEGLVMTTEVKTTDRLLASQIHTIGELLLRAGIKVEVVRARRRS